jgi:protein CWC15
VSGQRRENKRLEQAFPRTIASAVLTGLQEREKAAAEEAEREKDIALGNPLLNPKADFNVKRRYVCDPYQPRSCTYSISRWDDDVIFKNQARGTEDKGKKKEFVNVS